MYQIEERIKTHKKFKFPHFEEVNWLAAQKLKNDLSDLNSDSTLCPSHLLSGIKALLTTLKSWLPDIGIDLLILQNNSKLNRTKHNFITFLFYFSPFHRIPDMSTFY